MNQAAKDLAVKNCNEMIDRFERERSDLIRLDRTESQHYSHVVAQLEDWERRLSKLTAQPSDEELIASMNKPYRVEAVKSGWVSVKDRLPESREEVLCYTGSKRMGVSSYCLHTDQDQIWFADRFTHWMPLPPPPDSV